jgi:hypothetical protein
MLPPSGGTEPPAIPPRRVLRSGRDDAADLGVRSGDPSQAAMPSDAGAFGDMALAWIQNDVGNGQIFNRHASLAEVMITTDT